MGFLARLSFSSSFSLSGCLGPVPSGSVWFFFFFFLVLTPVLPLLPVPPECQGLLGRGSAGGQVLSAWLMVSRDEGIGAVG